MIVFKVVAYDSLEWQDAVQLRESVLRKPLGSGFSREELLEEQHHFHVAGFLQGELIATAVLVPEGKQFKMQRVAVNAKFRNRDIGSQMMTFCESYAHSKACTSIYCHARDSAVNFYRNNGYKGEGDYFEEDGIPHLKMVKLL